MSEQALKGLQNPESGATEYNALAFLVRQILADCNFATLVQVKKCTNNGGVAAVGTVDVQPLLNQQDGFGNAVPHGRLYSLPYVRVQGGVNAVIIDPAVGDIGIAVFADKDVSVVKSTKTQSSPGSGRRFSMSDGLYIGGVLNAAPTNYVQFSGNNINVTATGAVNVKAPAINLENTGSALQTLLNSTLLTWLNSHVHSGITSGTGVSGPPSSIPPSTVSTTITKAE